MTITIICNTSCGGKTVFGYCIYTSRINIEYCDLIGAATIVAVEQVLYRQLTRPPRFASGGWLRQTIYT